MKVFVVDANAIYRRGVVASLELLDGVESVRAAGSVAEAADDPGLPVADVVLVDETTDGAAALASRAASATVVPVRRATLTPEWLEAAVRAAANGGVAPTRPRLTDRERQVLRLIASGHPTREVAEQLSYSERTVKNVLHDVVVKLGARSRAQAVAYAVRDGLI